MPACLRHALIGAVTLLLACGAHALVTSGEALSPQRTSIEADFSQVFSARFHDAAGNPAAGETVRFSNDTCGRFPNGGFFHDVITDAAGVASTSFTAMQPGGTVCWIIASAGPAARVRFDVFTYRLSQVAIVAEPWPAKPAPGAGFEIPVQVKMGAYALPNVQLGARVIPLGGAAEVTPAIANTGQAAGANLRVEPRSAGDFDVEVSVRALAKRVPIRFALAPAPIHQDLWWDPSENGWGLSIVERRDVLFVMIYAYDDAGRPTWYVMSNGTWNAARTAYTGALHHPRGSPYDAYDASRLAMGAPVGSATLTFGGNDHATLDYTIGGVQGRKSISRFLFGPPAAAPMAGRTGMWWGGPSQNGWGLAVIQQNALLFVMWYTYDADGRPLWLSMPSGSWTAPDAYEGRVYRATGSPWLGRAYDPALFRPIDVGSYRLRFSGEAATFEYAIQGASGSIPLARFDF